VEIVEMSKLKRVYLACPYSHVNAEVKQTRFEAVNKIAAEFMAKGYLIFSPISHTHPIALAGALPGHWEFWEAYDRTFIEWADELWVLKLEGWNMSKGVKAEIAIAKAAGKPVRYIEP
jgi:nucleoside 2-deoxyribosyltransferase